jgi:sigma-B regulation protein RsbU (phosphoserine phosphatase)
MAPLETGQRPLRGHILVIDDDAAIRLTLQQILQKQGYPVSVASDGEMGLEMALRLRPALIVCDWVMPKLNGIEVCRQVKAQLSTCAFILLTSRSGVDDIVTGLDAGADDFLRKPTDASELIARVRAGLRTYRLSRALQEQTLRLEAELAEAADYVRSLLPPRWEGAIAADWVFLPSTQLGGDGFHYHWLDGEHLAIYLLDVSGHGVGSALLSASVMHVLRSRALPQTDFTQPAAVLQALNLAFPMESQNDKYFTIWYGVYSQQQRQLTYASAGHPPALTIGPNRSCQLLQSSGIPVGLLREVDYTQQSCLLEDCSTLYLFSDGIYELTCGDGTAQALENFMTLLARLHQQAEGVRVSARCHAPLALDRLLAEVRFLNGGDRFADDLSILQLQFR